MEVYVVIAKSQFFDSHRVEVEAVFSTEALANEYVSRKLENCCDERSWHVFKRVVDEARRPGMKVTRIELCAKLREFLRANFPWQDQVEDILGCVNFDSPGMGHNIFHDDVGIHFQFTGMVRVMLPAVGSTIEHVENRVALYQQVISFAKLLEDFLRSYEVSD